MVVVVVVFVAVVVVVVVAVAVVVCWLRAHNNDTTNNKYVEALTPCRFQAPKRKTSG